jgi:hypothetical protein
LILEQVDVLGFELTFDVVPSADFKVCFAPVVKPAFDVFGVPDVFEVIPLVVPCIIDGGILLPG